jgi:UrcA family protein
MSSFSRPSVAALLSLALALPFLASAQSSVREIVVQGAAPGVEVRSEKVSFTDLNLDRPAGAHTLLGRLRGAAQRVCGTDGGRADHDYQACVAKALDRAVTEVDNPLLTSLHHSRG